MASESCSLHVGAYIARPSCPARAPNTSAIEGWDETVPYPAPWQYKDEYSRTKAEAEQMVLAGNGTWLPVTPDAAASEERNASSTAAQPPAVQEGLTSRS